MHGSGDSRTPTVLEPLVIAERSMARLIVRLGLVWARLVVSGGLCVDRVCRLVVRLVLLRWALLPLLSLFVLLDSHRLVL